MAMSGNVRLPLLVNAVKAADGKSALIFEAASISLAFFYEAIPEQ